MNLAQYSLDNTKIVYFFLAVLLIGGILSFGRLGKKEDAPFVIKSAVIMTRYPGAEPAEVERLVTEPISREIQSMSGVYKIKSESMYGLSKITFELQPSLSAASIPQKWDELRRKVLNIQPQLPAGSSVPTVSDDFGDVFGIYYGLVGDDGFSYEEMRNWAERIKTQVITADGVMKVALFGTQTEVIHIFISVNKLAGMGIDPKQLASLLQSQNQIINTGEISAGEQQLRIVANGTYTTVDDIRNQVITTSGGQVKLGDIAIIEKGYMEPPGNIMHVNGKRAIGIGISTDPTKDVVKTGELVDRRLAELMPLIPVGLELESLYPENVIAQEANNGFIINLIESILIVIVIIMLVMGMRAGVLIGSSLIFSIGGTLLIMSFLGVGLNRTSLAGFIIAMGMLVDNAIVVSDSALINMERGMRKRVAIMRACSATALPLLAATVIAILTFLPIYYSPHITGELLSSLVVVIGVSLMFSWVFALTQTPFFIQEFVRRPRPEELKAALFDGKYYNRFRNSLHWVLCHRSVTIGSLVVMLILSAWSFKFIPKVFVPALDKQYFTVDMWLPEGTNINETDRMASNLANYIRGHEETEMVSTYIGRTPPRYYLSNVAFGPQSNYAQILVKCKTSQESRKLHALLQDSIRQKYPEPLIKVNKFELSPLTEAVIEARFLGPDPAVLDSLTGKAIEIMRRNPKVADARNEWGNMSLMIRPVYDPVKAGALGITKAQMMQSVKSVSDGTPIGIYRDNEKKVPVLLKSEGVHITDVQSLGDFPVWNGEHSAPLSQVTEKIETTWEFPQIRTYNRQLSMAAMCGVKPGHTMAEVHGEIREEIEAIELPEGYSFFWDAQYKDQGEAMQAIAKFFPLAFLMLVVILVALFGNFRQPIIILCILPLSLIGVAVGMLLTGFDFGFFPIAGWLGLLGMIIKNVIVLLDEINIQRRNGVAPYTAVVEATVSRTRPVLMAATTTILGMVPLLFDIAFGGMAATIIFGLTFATLLTLFITPTLYAMFYKIK